MAANGTSDQRFEIGDAVIYQDIHQELVLLNMESQQYYGLDDIGAEMWRLLLELGDADSVAARVQARYQIDPETARNDVISLADELVKAGLMKITGGNEN